MRVIDINGRLATAGSWDETSQSEAAAQARLRATRTSLRAMLAWNEAFHVDPMSAQKLAPKRDEQAAFEDWAYRVCPSGDVTAVHAQWRDSTEYAEWRDEQDGDHAIDAAACESGAALIGTKTEPEADTPAPAAQESAKPTFAVGCRIVILPHPEGGKHPSPFLSLMNGTIGKSGTVRHILESGNVDVCLDDRRMFIFPPSSLAIIQA